MVMFNQLRTGVSLKKHSLKFLKSLFAGRRSLIITFVVFLCFGTVHVICLGKQSKTAACGAACMQLNLAPQAAKKVSVNPLSPNIQIQIPGFAHTLKVLKNP